MWFSKNKLIKLKNNMKSKKFDEDTITIEESIITKDREIVDLLQNIFINRGYVLSTGDSFDTYSYFERKKNGILFFVYLPILNYSYQMFFRFEDRGVDIIGVDEYELQESQMKDVISKISFVIISELAYANFTVINHKTIVEENTTSTKVRQPAKSKKNKTVKAVRNINITNVHRVINRSKNVNNKEKRSYERKIENWTARGHWRTYKSGKKIWIEPQNRKAKDGVSNKKVKKNYIIKKGEDE